MMRKVAKYLYRDELLDVVKVATYHFLQPVVEAVQGIQQIVERVQVRPEAVSFIHAEHAPGRCFRSVAPNLFFQTNLSHSKFYPLL